MGAFGLVKAGEPATSPTVVFSDSGMKVASGGDHIVILTKNKDILSLGCAEQGQLGRVAERFSSRDGRRGVNVFLKPQTVNFSKPKNAPKPKFDDIFCGTSHTFALTKDDALYTWGLNNYGQLGTSDTISRYLPERLPNDWLPNEAGKRYQDLNICGGENHSLLCNKGSVFVMGRKEYGRLGLGLEEPEPLQPHRVPELDGIRSVMAGPSCSFAVKDSGEVYSWGMGTNLQLGTGNEDDLWSPLRIGGKRLEGKKVLEASPGGQHTALLVSSSDQ